MLLFNRCHIWLFATPWTAAMPGFPVFYHLPELAQTHVHWVGDAIQPSHLSSPSPSAFKFSQHQESFPMLALRVRWPKYWSFRFTIRPSNEYSVLIFFRTGWLDLLAGQRPHKSLLQHHSSKASIFWYLAFLYGPTLIWLLEKLQLWLYGLHGPLLLLPVPCLAVFCPWTCAQRSPHFYQVLW